MKINTTTLIGAAIAFAVSTGASVAQEVTLKYSSWLPVTHWLNEQQFQPWFKKIEEVTEGRVKVETLPKTVGTANSQFDVISDGLADISFIVTSYSPGRFPLAGMGELPLLGSKPSESALIFETIYRENFMQANEFKGVELLSIWNITPNQIWNSRQPVTKLEDLAGMKLRAPNDNVTQLLKSLGGVPINKPSSEAYELLSTGAIDGQITQADTIVAQNMVPLTKYGTIVPGGLTNATLAIIANPDAWNSISEKDRKAIEEITTYKLSDDVGTAYEERETSGTKVLKDAGYEIITADEEFVNNVREAAKPIEEAWIAAAKEKGIEDPAAVLAEFRTRVQEAEKASN
ncbi:TRAP transporter substrate-binding protein [Aquibium sp. LZ166]|uniref:TRAP transporter substrate-binding protein n=1 Tax=Aquibium pacificus TaxID=3153579 RepID=A0ABV3SL11_9HYPH